MNNENLKFDHNHGNNDNQKSSSQDFKDFAYIVSHDLKKPLRAISNYSQFLLEDYEGKFSNDADNMLHKLKMLSKKAQEIVDLVYDYACIDQVNITDEVVDLKITLDELTTKIEKDFCVDAIEIRIAENIPNITCNKFKITQVFGHIIKNAVIYNTKPVKRINISYSDSDDQFLIEDNGVGINSKHVDDVLKMFKRGYNKDIEYEGVGVGLAMAKKIIEYYDGNIRLDSKLLHGTKVYFNLPNRTIKNNEQ